MSNKSTTLLNKSKDAMLTAIQSYNNPNISFKSENYIVLSIIAWTYLVHAYLKIQGIDYRYFTMNGQRKVFNKTRYKNYKYWSLYDCLSKEYCDIDIDKGTNANLNFLIGIRNEIEHQMTNQIDKIISAKIQANCLNYNEYLTKWFGKRHDLSKNIAYSLQFANLSNDQIEQMKKSYKIPVNIQEYIKDFDSSLDEETYNSQHFAYRVIFTPKLVNHPSKADQVIEYIPPDTELSRELNSRYAVIKETERPKYRAKEIIQKMHNEGYKKLNQYLHTQLWKRLDAKNPQKGYGTFVSNYWYWYENWIDEVRKYCKEIDEFLPEKLRLSKKIK